MCSIRALLHWSKSTSARKLLPSETRIVHSTNIATKSYLRNSITKGSVRQSDIYSIPSSSCNLQCIGESDDLDRRLQQHKHDILKYNRNNRIVKYISDHKTIAYIPIMLQLSKS